MHTLDIIESFLYVTFVAFVAWFYWGKSRLFFMSKGIPGPLNLPFVGCGLQFIGNTTQTFQNMMNIMLSYSDLSKLWFGNRLYFVVTKPEYLEIVLNSPYCLEKDHLYKFARQAVGTGIFTAPVKKWKKHRRMLSPAFNKKILDSFVDNFAEHSRIFIDILQERVGEGNFDIFPIMGAFNLDSLCESIMGINVGAQKNHSELSEWIDEMMNIVYLRMAVIWYNFDFIFNRTKMPDVLERNISKMRQFTNKVIEKKLNLFKKKIEELRSGEEINGDVGSKQCLLDLLLQYSYEGSKMTLEELREEVDTFTIAGTDTTTATLSFCFIMLGMHYELQQKVFHEVTDILGEDRDVTASDIARMHLLEQFIKETLRIFPIGPLILRSVEADIDLGDFVLPKDSALAIGIIGLHRNAKYWKDPLKFDPDRFSIEESAKRHPYSYLAFAGGPRNCIGAKYAMMLMKSLLAMIVRKFIIRTAYKSIEDIKLTSYIVLRPVDGFKISLERRQ